MYNFDHFVFVLKRENDIKYSLYMKMILLSLIVMLQALKKRKVT